MATGYVSELLLLLLLIKTQNYYRSSAHFIIQHQTAIIRFNCNEFLLFMKMLFLVYCSNCAYFCCSQLLHAVVHRWWNDNSEVISWMPLFGINNGCVCVDSVCREPIPNVSERLQRLLLINACTRDCQGKQIIPAKVLSSHCMFSKICWPLAVNQTHIP